MGARAVTRIRRLLIANRGEIARRIIRTAHRMGMATVAVYSDVDAHALHVRDATTAVALGGSASADSYLRIDKLIAAAKATGADAIHPGYGFLSENAALAQAVIDAGLAWVGPPPEAIRTLGSKSSAKELALARGRSLPAGLPGRGPVRRPLRGGSAAHRLPANGEGGGRRRRPWHAAGDAGVAAPGRAAQCALGGAVGFRLRRAAAGTGVARARGTSKCRCSPTHTATASTWASAIARCSGATRRSSRRRPAPPWMRRCASAWAAARWSWRRLRAMSARGRWNFWWMQPSPQPSPDGEGAIPFFLMEMNTRLQVEHPVTEVVTGLDLVEWQLRVAQGEALPLSQERGAASAATRSKCACAPRTSTSRRTPALCCIFSRPLAGEGGGGGTRFDHAMFEGLQVSPHYDSMLGKLIVHAADTRRSHRPARHPRSTAPQVLGLPTNRRLLAACLRHPGSSWPAMR